MCSALAIVAQVVGASSHDLKGHEFDSWSGHIPRLQVRSLVGEPMEGDQSMFFCCIDVPPSLSLKTMKKCPQVRIKK